MMTMATREQPVPQVNIDKGAIELSVDPIINVKVPHSVPRAVKRESEFVTDDTGRIVGKKETETEYEVGPKSDIPAIPRGKTVVETSFKTDDKGRIIGKTETEMETF
jgi:predicted RNA-binding protein YlqC (UPF0109 family)